MVRASHSTSVILSGDWDEKDSLQETATRKVVLDGDFVEQGVSATPSACQLSSEVVYPHLVRNVADRSRECQHDPEQQVVPRQHGPVVEQYAVQSKQARGRSKACSCRGEDERCPVCRLDHVAMRDWAEPYQQHYDECC